MTVAIQKITVALNGWLGKAQANVLHFVLLLVGSAFLGLLPMLMLWLISLLR
jgi:hypothetical protein